MKPKTNKENKIGKYLFRTDIDFYLKYKEQKLIEKQISFQNLQSI